MRRGHAISFAHAWPCVVLLTQMAWQNLVSLTAHLRGEARWHLSTCSLSSSVSCWSQMDSWELIHIHLESSIAWSLQQLWGAVTLYAMCASGSGERNQGLHIFSLVWPQVQNHTSDPQVALRVRNWMEEVAEGLGVRWHQKNIDRRIKCDNTISASQSQI